MAKGVANSSRVKIFFSYRKSVDQLPEIEAIHEDTIHFSKASQLKSLKLVKTVEFHFKVSGKWKSYLCEGVYLKPGPDDQKCLEFSLPESTRTAFKRDLCLAR